MTEDKATRGGSRPNAGRKKGEEKTTISVRLSPSAMEILDSLPKGTRNEFIESAIIEKNGQVYIREK